MDEERLRLIIATGASLPAIAEAHGVDVSTARRRLRKLGLETRQMATQRAFREARDQGLRHLERTCPAHGTSMFRRDARGSYRCLACRAERVAARRRRIKEVLVAEAGGACRVCGYDRCLRALEFHHRDPAEKAFGVAYRGATRSLARARAEAAKCILLCSNCHMEVEAGVRSVAFAADVPG